MSECRQPLSGRLPPHVEGPAGRFADRLRTSPDTLDEVTQARMERAIVGQLQARVASRASAAARTGRRGGAARSGRHRAARVSGATQAVHALRRRWRARLAYSGLVITAAAVGAALVLLVQPPQRVVVSQGGAQFEMHLPDGAVQRGPVAEGQTLESGRQSRIHVALDRSRIDLDRRSRVRFDRLSDSEVELTLGLGRIEVGFHPRVRGEQRMLVQTEAACVRVVGTRFTVDVDGRGNTRVRVSEGEVEVQPKYGGPAHAVRAGEDLEVMADPGDDSERAVREALAENLSKLSRPQTPMAPEDGALAPEEEPLSLLQTGANPGVEAAPATGPDDAVLPQLAKPLYLSAVRVRKRLPRPVLSPTSDELLEMARERLREGRHALARQQLMSLASDGQRAPDHRAEAWTLIAESYTAQGYIPHAREAYTEAAAIAPDLGVGHNALFALARLLDRYTRDQQAALLAYEDYLRKVPQGALAAQARHALCRLGGYPDQCKL